MGWTFSESWATKKDLVNYLRSQVRLGEGRKLIRSCVVGNNHWYLLDVKGTVLIGLDLLKGGTRANPGWGYKDLDESCGPNEANCPLLYLDLVGEPVGYASEWRERVRIYHQKQKAKVKPAPGLEFTYGGSRYRLCEPKGMNRRGWIVMELSDSGEGIGKYGISSALLARALAKQ